MKKLTQIDLPKKLKTVEIKEFRSIIKDLISRGTPIYGLNPNTSRAFDDYVIDTSESLNIVSGNIPTAQNEKAFEYFESLFKERNRKVLEDLHSKKRQPYEGKSSNSLSIKENHSFDDVPATQTAPSILDRTRVNFEDEEFKELPSIIKIGGKPFGSLGNFSMIIGKAKSKKTFFATLLASAAIGGKDESNTITIDLPEGKPRVVMFDTEQSEGHVFQLGSRIRHMTPNYQRGSFEVFSLRGEPVEDRLKAPEELLEKHDEVGLVIIDGIKDLSHEINNEKQASDIANKLLGWTQRFNIHIIVVLHTNKGDDSPRGHLGGELQNKAETTVSISNQKNLALIKSVMSRNEEIPSIGLKIKKIDVDNQEVIIPYIIQDPDLDKNGKVGKVAIKPQSIPKEIHIKILKQLNVECSKGSIRKTRAKKLIKEFAESHDFEFGLNKAQEFLSFYEKENWVSMVKPQNGGRDIIQVDLSSIQ